MTPGGNRPEFAGDAVAVVVCRDGRLPAGTGEAIAEATGQALLVGSGVRELPEIPGAVDLWIADTPLGLGALARSLAQVLAGFRVVIMPASPDGRDLAPRLAAEMGRPFLGGAVGVTVAGAAVQADLLRVDGRVVVTASCDQPAVATLMPGSRSAAPSPSSSLAVTEPAMLDLPAASDDHEAETLTLVEPDPATMDLADARRVIGGGAGLVPDGVSDEDAGLMFELLGEVSRALGASAGATRVVTDAGWMVYDRQIGTTGVTVDPDIYIALGISGASQHVGGLGAPDHIASVNLDASAPMTEMAELGIISDAPRVLLKLAERLGVDIPPSLSKLLNPEHAGPTDHSGAITAKEGRFA